MCCRCHLATALTMVMVSIATALVTGTPDLDTAVAWATALVTRLCTMPPHTYTTVVSMDTATVTTATDMATTATISVYAMFRNSYTKSIYHISIT
jgi:hypothetical protein